MRGFTLVELVMVIVLLGILSVGMVQFISHASFGFASTAARTELASSARLALERVALELRGALPNSVRDADGRCIEYIPALGASRYLTLPIEDRALSFRSMPMEPGLVVDGKRIAVYPDTPGNVYALSSVSVVSPPAEFSRPDAGNVVTATFAAAHRFPNESARKRFFAVGDPVSFCVSGGRLWRYEGYGYEVVQPTVATLPAALPQRALVAENISPASKPFRFRSATLLRNATVAIDLLLEDHGDQIRIDRVVQLRNVP